MPTGTKHYVEDDVYELAKQRLRLCFERYDNVSVSFSGGKDSTVCLNLSLEIAKEMDRLPLDVVSFDEEAIPPQTVEYMRRVAQRDDVSFRWLCVPIYHRNACSRTSPDWHPWAPEDKDKWVRELPPEAITDFPGFAREDILSNYFRLCPPTQGTTCCVVGIRTQESLSRFRSIARKSGSEAFISKQPPKHFVKASPIYDWSAEDVWLAPHIFGWDYNRAYDVMTKAGVPLAAQRCAPPFGEQPIRQLHLFKTCWPELWGKMVGRVPGAATAARYANTRLYLSSSIEAGDDGLTWRERTYQRMHELTDSARAEVAAGIRICVNSHYKRSSEVLPDEEPDPQSGYSWKGIYEIAHVGGNKFGRIQQRVTSKALGTLNKMEKAAAAAAAKDEP